MAQQAELFTVSGEVRDARTEAVLPGVVVRAWDLDHMGAGEALGEAVTGRDGTFRIAYRKGAFVRSVTEALAKTGPYLVLRVSGPDGDPVRTVRAVPRAAQNERVVLKVETGRDEPSGGPVAAWVSALGLTDVRSVADLRERAPTPVDAAARLGEPEAERLGRFLALSRLFPARVAAALEAAGAAEPEPLCAWPPARFANALRLAGIAGSVVAVERARFDALRTRGAEAVPDGLALDLGGRDVLVEQDRQALAAAGVATLDDWSERRETVAVSDPARALLDAHARLRGAGIPPDAARGLIAAGVTGARALVRLPADERAVLTARLGIDDARMADLAAAAAVRLATVEHRLLGTLVHAAGPLPPWLDPRRDAQSVPAAASRHLLSAAAHARALAAGEPGVSADLRVWRTRRRAALYPGTALRAGSGDLSGSPDLSAFVRSEVPVTRELDAVAAALAGARLQGSGGAAEPLPNSEWWPGIKAGLHVLRAVSVAAAHAGRAHDASARGDARAVLATLDAACAELTSVAGLVFRPESIWRGADGEIEAVLAALPAAARRQRLAALADELWRGPKRLFSPVGPVARIPGHDPESGLFTHLDGWEPAPGWRVGRPEDGIGLEGRISRSPTGEDPSIFGTLVQRGPHRFPDCRMTVALRRRPTGAAATAAGEAFGLAARARERSGYRLLLRAGTGSAASRWALVLDRCDGRGGATELARTELPVRIDDGREVRLVFTVSGRSLTGEVMLPSGETRAVAFREDRFLAVPLHGAIGFVASETAEILFGPFWVRAADEAAPSGAPFFADRRARLPDPNRLPGEPGDPWEPPSEPLLRRGDDAPAPSRGLSREGRPLALAFPANGDAVSLDALDRRLDACLRLSFRLRFGSIPLLRADAEARLGEYERAFSRLRLLYDDTVPAAVSPLLAPPPPGFAPTVSADERLLRLRFADLHLRAAAAVAASGAAGASVIRRHAAERVHRLHDGIGDGAEQARSRSVSDATLALVATLAGAPAPDRAAVVDAVARALAAIEPRSDAGAPPDGDAGAGRRRLDDMLDEAEVRLGLSDTIAVGPPDAAGSPAAGELLAAIVGAGGLGPEPLAAVQRRRARLLAAEPAIVPIAAARHRVTAAALQLRLVSGATAHYRGLLRDGPAVWERAAFGFAASPCADAIGFRAAYEERRAEWEERVRIGDADMAVAQEAVGAALAACAAAFAAEEIAEVERVLVADGVPSRPEDGVSAMPAAPTPEAAGRLHLSKTISLAAMMPGDIQRFRDGDGHLPFRTRLAWFDRDFPGHRDRRIERVRLSLIAPGVRPAELHGTLTNVGISRVVTASHIAAETERRDPETVALRPGRAGPDGAVALLPVESGAAPFAGPGVECDWLLDLPKAANRIDFAAITDLILTIDYTACADDALRRRVTDGLDRRVGGERAFSLRQAFADAWARLLAGDTARGSDVGGPGIRFETATADFPANLAGLAVAHVTVALVGRDGMRIDLDAVSLRYDRPSGRTGPNTVTGVASPESGLVSTRRPDLVGDHPWRVFAGLPPTGTWSLTLPDTPAMRDRLARGDLFDIVFVLAYTGERPPWEP